MTYLGTRPILPDELEQYELHHRARIAIKPGITGMWQVSGRSDITDFEEIVRLDTEYISKDDAYDICIIDCPPTPSVWMTSAIIASDYYLIPSKPDPISMTGLNYPMVLDNMHI